MGRTLLTVRNAKDADFVSEEEATDGSLALRGSSLRSDDYIDLLGVADPGPGLSGVGDARLWYDSSNDLLKLSKNGNAFESLEGGGGSFSGDVNTTTQGYLNDSGGTVNIRSALTLNVDGTETPDSGTFSFMQSGVFLLHQMRTEDPSDGPTLLIEKSNIGPSAVADGDNVFNIVVRGHDGTDYLTPGGKMIWTVDGTPGTNDVPMKLVFQLQESGSTLNNVLTLKPTQAVRVHKSLEFELLATAPSVSNPGEAVVYFDTTANKLKASENGGAFADVVGAFTGDLESNDLENSTTNNVNIIDRVTIVPADTLTSGQSPLTITATLPSSNFEEIGLRQTYTVDGADNEKVGSSVILNQGGGTAPNGFNAAYRGTNNITGTANSTQYGMVGFANGSSLGGNVGGRFQASNGDTSIGIQGTATTDKLNGTNVGACISGRQTSGTNTQVGIWVDMGSGTPTFNASGAAIISNSDTSEDILVLRDNATAVLTVADGGEVTFSGNLFQDTGGKYIGGTQGTLPGLSAAGTFRIAMDSADSTLKASVDGGAYSSLGGGSSFTGDLNGSSLTDETQDTTIIADTSPTPRNIILRMSDAAGSQRVIMQDSGSIEVNSVNSDGVMRRRGGSFASAGDAQVREFVLRGTTTNATETELFVAGDGSTRITLPSGSAMIAEVEIVGWATSGTNLNKTESFRFTALLKNDVGTTSVVGDTLSDNNGGDGLTWSASVTADDTNDAVAVKVTGEASHNIRWVAFVRTVEVSG